MEEYADEIRKYLPISFRNPENEEYIEYLTTAYTNNLFGEFFQFGFIAFHLLYMSYIYKVVWFLKENNVSGISRIIRRYPHIVNGNSPFNLSTLGEKKIIEQAIQLLGFHPNQIRDFCSVIEKRDHCAHASGVVQYKKNHVEMHINNELEYVESIQQKLKPYLEKIFKDFLYTNWNPDSREFILVTDAVDDFIKDYMLSSVDLEFMSTVELLELKQKTATKKIMHIKSLYLVFLKYIENYIEFDKSIFLEKLNILAQGLDKKLSVPYKQLLSDQFSILTLHTY